MINVPRTTNAFTADLQFLRVRQILDAVRLFRDFTIMRYQEDRPSRCYIFPEITQHDLCVLVVQVSRNFVRQQDLRSKQERSRQRCTLLFPGAQFGWRVVQPSSRPNCPGELPAPALIAGPSLRSFRREVILQDAQIRYQVILLKDEPDVLRLESGELVPRHGMEIVAVDQRFARVGAQQPAPRSGDTWFCRCRWVLARQQTDPRGPSDQRAPGPLSAGHPLDRS